MYYIQYILDHVRCAPEGRRVFGLFAKPVFCSVPQQIFGQSSNTRRSQSAQTPKSAQTQGRIQQPSAGLTSGHRFKEFELSPPAG
jgi:hypothetical protein